jgi:DNA-binding response OmpR family regulator
MGHAILIIDDEPDIRALVNLMLSDVGYVVREAGTGEEGLALIAVHDINLVILDVMLPDINGWALCRQLKTDRATARLPVVIFTVRSQIQDELLMARACPDGFINKPFDRVDLLQTIRDLLDEDSSSVTGQGLG